MTKGNFDLTNTPIKEDPPLYNPPPHFDFMRERMNQWLNDSVNDFTIRLRQLTGDETIVATFLFYIHRTDVWNITFFYGSRPFTPLDPSPGMFLEAKEEVTRPAIYALIALADEDNEGAGTGYLLRLDEDAVRARIQLGALHGLERDGDIILPTDITPDGSTSLSTGFEFISRNLVQLPYGQFKPLGGKFLVPRLTDEVITFNELLALIGTTPDSLGY